MSHHFAHFYTFYFITVDDSNRIFDQLDSCRCCLVYTPIVNKQGPEVGRVYFD